MEILYICEKAVKVNFISYYLRNSINHKRSNIELHVQRYYEKVDKEKLTAAFSNPMKGYEENINLIFLLRCDFIP